MELECCGEDAGEEGLLGIGSPRTGDFDVLLTLIGSDILVLAVLAGSTGEAVALMHLSLTAQEPALLRTATRCFPQPLIPRNHCIGRLVLGNWMMSVLLFFSFDTVGDSEGA